MRFASNIPNYYKILEQLYEYNEKSLYSWRLSDGFKYDFTGLNKLEKKSNISWISYMEYKQNSSKEDITVYVYRNGRYNDYRIPIMCRRYKEGEIIGRYDVSLKYSNDEINRVSKIEVSPLNK